MTSRARVPETDLRAPMAWSLLLHGGLIAAALVLGRRAALPPTPPMYRVDLVAAPPGERTVGIVAPKPASRPTTPAPPARAQVAPREMPVPTAKPEARRPPAQATPTAQQATPAKPGVAPQAAGGPTGGRGSDVVTVRTNGIEFPYPGYLENIVRQIALNFHPPRGSALRAEVSFLVRRDGSISDFKFLSKSGNYEFDLEAQGAVEAVGRSRSIGPLPEGFRDDVLPVIFSFDPRVIR